MFSFIRHKHYKVLKYGRASYPQMAEKHFLVTILHLFCKFENCLKVKSWKKKGDQFFFLERIFGLTEAVKEGMNEEN